MIKFNAEVHTVENLAAQVAEVYQAAPEALLVGSLGRAILYNHLAQDSLYELRQRREQPLYHGIKARDIDLIIGAPAPSLPQAPFFTDTRAYDNPGMAVIKDGNNWLLTSKKRNFAELLHPATMEPVAGRGVLGITAQTVPLQTNLALIQARGPLRRKDDLPVSLLQAAIEASPNKLPDEMYAPFRKLASLSLGRSEMLVRQVYHRILPSPVEARIDWLLTRNRP